MRRKKTIPPIEKLAISGTAKKGKGIGRTGEGQVVFVQGAIPGDVVDVAIQKKKRRHLEGKISHFHKKSLDRTAPACAHFDTCGGCTWQHMDYGAQLRHKQQEVIDALSRIGGVEVSEYAPIIGCDETFGYRNKMEFSFSAKRWLTPDEIINNDEVKDRTALGFHIPGMWDKIVDIEYCHLQTELPNRIRNEVKRYARQNGLSFYNAREKNGFLRSLMLRNTIAGEIMVVIQFFYEDKPDRIGLLEHLKDTFTEITSLQYIVNEKANDTIYDQDVICYHGTTHINETMGDLTFRITPKAFYQTNSTQAEILYAKALEMAAPKKTDVVYDLYTGLGTIAQYISHKCKKVVGVESVSEAVIAAKENTKRNGISNTDFEVGDMRKVFTENFVAHHGIPDIIITDPPRDGMHKEVIKQLLNLNTPKILYISCNPQTQARDLELLCKQYKVEKSQAIDMFPHTQHIENIVLLKHKK